MFKQQVIAVQRVLQDSQSGAKWNNKNIRWSIVHNTNNSTKPYDIQLEMVILSSKRIVKVNNDIRNQQMCNFGYQANFAINDKLNGYIKQEGITFQLFINNQSYTKLSQSSNTYQPPKLSIESTNFNQLQKKSSPKKQSLSFINLTQPSLLIKSEQNSSNQSIPIQSLPSQSTFALKQISFASKSISSTSQTIAIRSAQLAIKDTQSQLMKILLEQKRRKKQQKLKAQGK